MAAMLFVSVTLTPLLIWRLIWLQTFRGCYPVSDKQQEQDFRKAVMAWLTRIDEAHPDAQLPRLAPSLLLAPQGERFYWLVLKLSSFVLKQRLQGKVPVVRPLDPKNPALLEASERALQLHIARQMEIIQTQHESSARAQQGCRDYVDELSQQLGALTTEKEKLLAQVRASRRDRRMTLAAAQIDQTNMASFERQQELASVREFWSKFDTATAQIASDRGMLQTIVSGTANSNSLDSRDLPCTMDERLASLVRPHIQNGSLDTVVDSGHNVNLVSLVKVWNLYLADLLAAAKRARAASGTKDSLMPNLQTTLSTLATLNKIGSAHLANAQQLRTDASSELDRLRESSVQRLPHGLLPDRTPPSKRATAVALKPSVTTPAAPPTHRRSNQLKLSPKTPGARVQRPSFQNDMSSSLTQNLGGRSSSNSSSSSKPSPIGVGKVQTSLLSQPALRSTTSSTPNLSFGPTAVHDGSEDEVDTDQAGLDEADPDEEDLADEGAQEQHHVFAPLNFSILPQEDDLSMSAAAEQTPERPGMFASSRQQTPLAQSSQTPLFASGLASSSSASSRAAPFSFKFSADSIVEHDLLPGAGLDDMVEMELRGDDVRSTVLQLLPEPDVSPIAAASSTPQSAMSHRSPGAWGSGDAHRSPMAATNLNDMSIMPEIHYDDEELDAAEDLLHGSMLEVQDEEEEEQEEEEDEQEDAFVSDDVASRLQTVEAELLSWAAAKRNPAASLAPALGTANSSSFSSLHQNQNQNQVSLNNLDQSAGSMEDENVNGIRQQLFATPGLLRFQSSQPQQAASTTTSRSTLRQSNVVAASPRQAPPARTLLDMSFASSSPGRSTAIPANFNSSLPPTTSTQYFEHPARTAKQSSPARSEAMFSSSSSVRAHPSAAARSLLDVSLLPIGSPRENNILKAQSLNESLITHHNNGIWAGAQSRMFSDADVTLDLNTNDEDVEDHGSTSFLFPSTPAARPQPAYRPSEVKAPASILRSSSSFGSKNAPGSVRATPRVRFGQKVVHTQAAHSPTSTASFQLHSTNPNEMNVSFM
ncbi:hypothetical protein, variant [Capsaspora owczarzaki ATCC 30864]|uniref:HAUS augmin-like complex subunit 6 N-terminal domain-containing protein n=1 Tax=Capsaspora owczarzaki (strain ATCC 30864) TaxID=595528 RepID=A0A0D2VTW7_CAPO3|nr:hypothetical protein, variant [Capsaspora owczarzaki ATCC 30864]